MTAERRWDTLSRRRILGVVLLVFLVFVTVAIQKDRQKGAPYPASAVAASVELSVVPAAQVQQRIDALAGAGRLTAAIPAGNAQTLVGRLRLTTPKNAPATGQYVLFVIDRRLGQPVPHLWGAGPAGTTVTSGWDGHYSAIASTYSWLAALRTQGSALGFTPRTPGPVTFQVVLDPSALAVTDPRTQLTVALVFLDASGRVYWADNLTS